MLRVGRTGNLCRRSSPLHACLFGPHKDTGRMLLVGERQVLSFRCFGRRTRSTFSRRISRRFFASSPGGKHLGTVNVRGEKDNKEEEEEKKKKKFGLGGAEEPVRVSRLLKHARPEAALLVGAFGALVVASATSLIMPAGIGVIIDTITAGVEPGETLSGQGSTLVSPSGIAASLSGYPLSTICAGLAGVFVLGAAATFARVALLNTAAERIVASMRKQTFRSILNQEVAFFDKTRTGELVNRLSSDIVVVAATLTDNVALGVKRVAEGAGGVCILLYMTPKLTGLMMLVLPPVALGGWFYGRFIRGLSKDVQDALSKSSQLAEEKIGNIRTVRMFGNEQKEIQWYAERVDHSFLLARRAGIARGMFYGGISLAVNLSLLTVMGFGGTLVLDGQMSVGDLASFLLYSMYVGISLSGGATFYSDIQKGLGASTRVFEILDRQPEINATGGLVPGQFKGEVRFDRVSFRYPKRAELILSDFNLDLLPGKSVAIVGPSGSGKSTLASLLARFYDVEKGRITVDGRDITELDPSWLRRQLGFVSQEPTLFATSIRENILYGIPENKKITQEEMVEASKQANAHNFIKEFPEGYDTYVGERGVTLSGGQKQRIAIARAVLKDPTLMILDEATSALDATSEQLVQQALSRIMQGRTTLVIAHRLSTIKNADVIAVLKNGTIVEKGSHHQLMNKHGEYRTLVTQQLMK